MDMLNAQHRILVIILTLMWLDLLALSWLLPILLMDCAQLVVSEKIANYISQQLIMN